MRLASGRLTRREREDLERQVTNQLRKLAPLRAAAFLEHQRQCAASFWYWTLETTLPPEAIKELAHKVADAFQKPRYVDAYFQARRNHINDHPEEMAWDERRALVEMVFSGQTSEGRRMGVYLEWLPGEEPKRRRKMWRYRIIGHLIDQTGFYRGNPDPEDEYLGGPLQRHLMAVVTKFAKYCTAPALPSHRFSAPLRPPET